MGIEVQRSRSDEVPTNDGRETQALRLLNGTAESPISTTVVEAAEVTFLKGGFGVIVFPRSVRGETLQPQRCLQSMFGTFFARGR
jgi:hypothetical protein